jgi:hypothetical protein
MVYLVSISLSLESLMYIYCPICLTNIFPSDAIVSIMKREQKNECICDNVDMLLYHHACIMRKYILLDRLKVHFRCCICQKKISTFNLQLPVHKSKIKHDTMHYESSEDKHALNTHRHESYCSRKHSKRAPGKICMLVILYCIV